MVLRCFGKYFIFACSGKVWSSALVLLQPSFILIDHGPKLALSFWAPMGRRFLKPRMITQVTFNTTVFAWALRHVAFTLLQSWKIVAHRVALRGRVRTLDRFCFAALFPSSKLACTCLFRSSSIFSEQLSGKGLSALPSRLQDE